MRLLGTGAGVAVALLLLVVVYRNQMASDRDAFWSSPFAAMASSTDVVAQTRENLAVRWSHGPQFFAVVSNYLSRGAAWSDTWKKGVIGALPTLIVPDKAVRANEHAIEFDLVSTGRFPFVDLAPTPWLHAVFDYGVIGLAVCACFFGFALRWLDRAMAARPITWARWFVLTSVFSVLAVPETKLDTIVVALREPIWIAALLAIGARVFRPVWSARVRPRPVMTPEPFEQPGAARCTHDTRFSTTPQYQQPQLNHRDEAVDRLPPGTVAEHE